MNVSVEGRNETSVPVRLVRIAGFLQRRVGDTMGEAHLVDFSLAANLQPKPDRQCIDDGNTDAMQTAGNLVGVLVELAARMQLRHDDFRCGNAFGMHIRRNTAAIVGHRARTIGIQRHGDARRVPRQRLVDRVVDDFVNHVVKAGPVIRITDIHSRAFAYSIQPLEDFDGLRTVFRRGFDCHLGCITHIKFNLS